MGKMEFNYDIEKINRENFRGCLEALARPGQSQTILPLFDSGLLAMASVLLYAEVSHHYPGEQDFELVRALCGSHHSSAEEADYLFFDAPLPEHLRDVKTGTAERPEMSATLVFEVGTDAGQEKTEVVLSGPGIKGNLQTSLPVDEEFLAVLKEKNEDFPRGIDLFFIGPDNRVLGLPRTTKVEVLA